LKSEKSGYKGPFSVTQFWKLSLTSSYSSLKAVYLFEDKARCAGASIPLGATVGALKCSRTPHAWYWRVASFVWKASSWRAYFFSPLFQGVWICNWLLTRGFACFLAFFCLCFGRGRNQCRPSRRWACSSIICHYVTVSVRNW
jgi:hypothetical protein